MHAVSCLRSLPPGKYTRLFICSALLSITLLCLSCQNPINAKTASNYLDAARQAEAVGDFERAAQFYSRVYGNAELGHLGPAAEASGLYGWARMAGHLGRTQEAEEKFADTLHRITQARGAADHLLPPTLSEYSRLLHDTAQHAKAIPIYEQALPALEKVGADQSDPIAFAIFLEDFSGSLRAIGQNDRAAEFSRRAQVLRAAHPDAKPQFEARRYSPARN